MKTIKHPVDRFSFGILVATVLTCMDLPINRAYIQTAFI